MRQRCKKALKTVMLAEVKIMTVISCSQVTGITVAIRCGSFVRRAIRHGRSDSDLRDPDIALVLCCNTTGRAFKDISQSQSFLKNQRKWGEREDELPKGFAVVNMFIISNSSPYWSYRSSRGSDKLNTFCLYVHIHMYKHVYIRVHV